MDIGLLWFDGTDRDIAEKVMRATQRYQERFEERPNTCYTHTGDLPDGEITCGEITVKPSSNQLPGHFWIGRETKSDHEKKSDQLQFFSGG